MRLQLTKLLPKSFTSQVWKDYLNAIQRFIENDFKPQITRIKTQYQKDNMTPDDFRRLLYYYGFTLTEGNFYTGTDEYLRREAMTAVQRIRTKTTLQAYDYLFYIFNMLGDVFPLYVTTDDDLRPWLDWVTNPETEIVYFTLDAEPTPYKLDGSLDNILRNEFLLFDDGGTFDDGTTFDDTAPVFDNPAGSTDISWQLDDPNFLNQLTRHLLISYSHRFLEVENKFITPDTAKAYYNDVLQAKLNIEIPHFEARITLSANSNNTVRTTEYSSEDETITGEQKSLFFAGGDLFDAKTVRLGSSSYTTVDNSITNVATLVQEFDVDTELNVKLQTATSFIFKNILEPSFKLDGTKITEIAILDSSDNIIFYSQHPEINFDPAMLSSMYYTIEIIS